MLAALVIAVVWGASLAAIVATHGRGKRARLHRELKTAQEANNFLRGLVARGDAPACTAWPAGVQPVVAGFWAVNDAIFLAQRWPSSVEEWSEAWALPGGKIEPGERPEEALRREYLEELSAEVDIGCLLCAYVYRVQGYPRPVMLLVYLINGATTPVLTRAGGQAAAWVPTGQIALRKCLPSTFIALASFQAMSTTTQNAEEDPA